MLDRGFLVQAGVFIFPGWKDLKVSGLPASHAFRVKSLIIEQTRITFFHFSWKLLAPISFAGSSCIAFSRAEKNLLHNSSVALRDKVATNYGNVIHLLHSPLSFHFFVLLIRWRDSELFTGLTFVLLNHGEFFWFEYSRWNEKAEMTLRCWNQRPLYNVPQQTINMATATLTMAFSKPCSAAFFSLNQSFGMQKLFSAALPLGLQMKLLVALTCSAASLVMIGHNTRAKWQTIAYGWSHQYETVSWQLFLSWKAEFHVFRVLLLCCKSLHSVDFSDRLKCHRFGTIHRKFVAEN